jgi:hypothetical protein
MFGYGQRGFEGVFIRELYHYHWVSPIFDLTFEILMNINPNKK